MFGREVTHWPKSYAVCLANWSHHQYGRNSPVWSCGNNFHRADEWLPAGNRAAADNQVSNEWPDTGLNCFGFWALLSSVVTSFIRAFLNHSKGLWLTGLNETTVHCSNRIAVIPERIRKNIWSTYEYDIHRKQNISIKTSENWLALMDFNVVGLSTISRNNLNLPQRLCGVTFPIATICNLTSNRLKMFTLMIDFLLKVVGMVGMAVGLRIGLLFGPNITNEISDGFVAFESGYFSE